MPKVSEEHLQARRRQITAAAARLVAERGVHSTSMRDVIAASGMSAGAVYHYFPSKADLLESIGDLALARYRDGVAELLATHPDPDPATLVSQIATLTTRPAPDGSMLSGVGLAMWSEALHDPQIAASTATIIRGLRGQLTTLAERWLAAGHLPAGTAPAAVASVLYALMPGYLLQHHVTKDVDPATFSSGLAALLGWSAATPSA